LKKVCSSCDLEFEAPHGKHIYCSDECRHDARKVAKNLSNKRNGKVLTDRYYQASQNRKPAGTGPNPQINLLDAMAKGGWPDNRLTEAQIAAAHSVVKANALNESDYTHLKEILGL
jgi:hypothetical protein